MICSMVSEEEKNNPGSSGFCLSKNLILKELMTLTAEIQPTSKKGLFLESTEAFEGNIYCLFSD